MKQLSVTYHANLNNTDVTVDSDDGTADVNRAIAGQISDWAEEFCDPDGKWTGNDNALLNNIYRAARNHLGSDVNIEVQILGRDS